MKTRCPHCETRFRVTKTQLEIADGDVRCGVCKKVYNAFDAANQHAQQIPVLDNENLDPDHLDTALSDTAHLDMQQEPITTEFDLFNDDSASANSIIPENFRQTTTESSPGILSTLLWGIGIVALCATLFVEYIWFNRDQFSQIAEVQAGIEQICKHIECKAVSIRDPSKIELITRNVYSHPNEKNALVINITMKNNADFVQPYPVMQVDFSDIRGKVVAARRFLPEEYLQLSTPEHEQLEPEASMSLNLEIKDPGKTAMTYEFNFL